MIALSTEQGFPFWLAWGTILRGWALAEQGQGEEGIAQIRQGLAAYRATGAELWRPYFLALLAEAYGKVRTDRRRADCAGRGAGCGGQNWGAFLGGGAVSAKRRAYACAQSESRVKVKSQKSENTDPRPLTPDPQGEAEACFLKAIEICPKQQAKSLELRAVMSLVRLRQQQATQSVSRTTQHATRAKLDESHKLLSDVYNWFTEGFDTDDLQEAKALLESLSAAMMTLRQFAHQLDFIPLSPPGIWPILAKPAANRNCSPNNRPNTSKHYENMHLIESAVSSNRIEGVEVEHTRIGTLVFGAPFLRDRDEEEVRGYRDALQLIHEQQAARPLSEDTIHYLHQLTRGQIWDAGHYKDKDSDIIEKTAGRPCPRTFQDRPCSRHG